MSVAIALTVNGQAVSAEVDSRTLLVQLIRDKLHELLRPTITWP